MPCTAKQKAVIDAAFNSMPDLTIGFQDGKRVLVDRCEESERQHRRHGHSPARGFSILTAARYFAVKFLRESVLEPEKRPKLKDVLKLRADYIYAAALAEEFANSQELHAWASSVSAEFGGLDYAELMA